MHQVAILIAQSEVLGLLTVYFTISNPTPEETRTAYYFAGALSLMTLLQILISVVFYAGRKLGGLIRISLTCAIYSKVHIIAFISLTDYIFQQVFKLSQPTLGSITMGHVINMASNDVHRFDEVCMLASSITLVFKFIIIGHSVCYILYFLPATYCSSYLSAVH